MQSDALHTGVRISDTLWKSLGIAEDEGKSYLSSRASGGFALVHCVEAVEVALCGLLNITSR